MALKREFLTALGIDENKADQIINAHRETIDALKNERDSFKADADKLVAVQKELDEAKAAIAKDGKDPYRVKYEALKEDFAQFKADLAAKEEKAKKTNSYRELLKQAGVADKRIDAVLRVSDVDALKYDADGNIEGADALLNTIKTEWSDFIPADNGGKQKVDFGGSLAGGGKAPTVDEIMAIKDDGERQAAILENHDLFGF